MAFENLEPFRDEILALRRPGPGQKTLAEICDHLLAKHKLRTTPGTLSRYLKDLKQPIGVALRDPDEIERQQIDALALLTEVLAEMRGRSDEQRVAIEQLAGQIAVHSRTIEELEKAIQKPREGAAQISAPVLRKIWLRAFAWSLLLSGAAAAALVWLLLRP